MIKQRVYQGLKVLKCILDKFCRIEIKDVYFEYGKGIYKEEVSYKGRMKIWEYLMVISKMQCIY